MVKSEYDGEEFIFISQHPRGLQDQWTNYFCTKLFPRPAELPSKKTALIIPYVEEEDIDGFIDVWEHTRFQFFPVHSLEDQAAVCQRMKFDIFSSSFMLAIYEEKYQQENIRQDPGKFGENVENFLFQRLRESINFVDEVRRGIDLVNLIRPTAEIDSMKMKMNIKLEIDDIVDLVWMQKKMEQEIKNQDGDINSEEERRLAYSIVFEETLESIASILRQHAQNGNYRYWSIGEDYEKRVRYKEVLLLKIFFSKNRLIVGLEIHDDFAMHSAFEMAVTSYPGPISAFVSHSLVQAFPFENILDLTEDHQDFMLSTMHNRKYLHYWGIETSRSKTRNVMWNIAKTELFVLQGKGENFNNTLDYIKVDKWEQILQQPRFLQRMDKIILPLGMSNLINMSYVETLQYVAEQANSLMDLLNIVNIGTTIILIINSVDSDLIQNLLFEVPNVGVKEISSVVLQITGFRTLTFYKLMKVAERIPFRKKSELNMDAERVRKELIEHICGVKKKERKEPLYTYKDYMSYYGLKMQTDVRQRMREEKEYERRTTKKMALDLAMKGVPKDACENRKVWQLLLEQLDIKEDPNKPGPSALFPYQSVFEKHDILDDILMNREGKNLLPKKLVDMINELEEAESVATGDEEEERNEKKK